MEEAAVKAEIAHWKVPLDTSSEANPKLFFALKQLEKRLGDGKIDLIHDQTRVTQVIGFFLWFCSQYDFSRMVPQMNIIMVSFVVTIGIGMLVFISSSDEYFQVAYKLYVDQLGEWFNFIRYDGFLNGR